MTRGGNIDRREVLGLAAGGGALFFGGIPRLLDSRSTGEHYRLYAHFDGEGVAEAALHAASLSWPRARRLLGREPERSAGPPLEIHLYPNKEAYARVEQRLTQGYFRNNESFSHWETMTAHVALAPPAPAGAIGLPMLSSQTLESIAHEAAHLAVYAAFPNYRWHPTWLAEGLALTVERQVAHELGTCTSEAEHPRFSTNLQRARALLAADRIPDLQLFLADRAEGLAVDENYALWQVLFDTLAAREGLVPALWREVDATPGGPAVRGRVLRYLVAEVGLGVLEAELRARIAASRPRWEERGRTLDTSQRPWIQRAFPGVESLAWRIPEAPRTWDRLEASVTLLAPGTQARLLVGRTPAPSIHVSLGRRLVFLEARAGDETSATGGNHAPLALGTAHRLGLHHEGDRLRLTLADEELVTLAVPSGFTAPPDEWGIGITACGAAGWSGVRAYSTS